MAELSIQERLQPSLLDRLTDDDPEAKTESRDKRVLTTRQLKEYVKRDLASLLNTSAFEDVEDLSAYPLVAKSVLNYGMPDITGTTLSGTNVKNLERRIKRIINHYEPRILKKSLRVNVHTSDNAHTSDEMSQNALRFEIECDIWAQPVPERMYLRTEMDLESGKVQVSDTAG